MLGFFRIDVLLLFILLLAVLVVIISKIIFWEKFKKKCFLILLSIFSTLSIGFITTILIIMFNIEPTQQVQIEQSIFQRLMQITSLYIDVFYYFAISSIALTLLVSIAGTILYLKNRNKNIFKRLLISYAILGIIFYFCMPTLVVGFDSNSRHTTMFASIDKYKKAYSLTKSKLLKYSFSVGIIANAEVQLTDFEKRKNENYYSTEEAQSLINDYIKYGEDVAQYGDYTFYIEMARKLIYFQQYDKSEKYIKLAEEKGTNLIEYKVALCIAKGEYNKALEIIETTNKEVLYVPRNYYMHLLQIYYGLNKYENMLKVLEFAKKENQLKKNSYYSYKALIYHKMGNENLAIKTYNGIKNKKTSYEKMLKEYDELLLKYNWIWFN